MSDVVIITPTDDADVVLLEIMEEGSPGPVGADGPPGSGLAIDDSAADFASLPAAADHDGAVYQTEDDGALYRSNGTAWVQIELGLTQTEVQALIDAAVLALAPRLAPDATTMSVGDMTQVVDTAGTKHWGTL
jgi:hypothetical protein